MLGLVSGLAAAACAGASSVRIARAVSPTNLHPGLLADEVARAGDGFAKALYERIEGEPRCDWERGLLSASLRANAPDRAGLINEQLTEFDGRVHDLARVPRVCASLSTTCGLLCATFVLVEGMGVGLGEEWGALLLGALASLAIGVAGSAFCIAAELVARRAARARSSELDRLVALLEASATQETEAQ